MTTSYRSAPFLGPVPSERERLLRRLAQIDRDEPTDVDARLRAVEQGIIADKLWEVERESIRERLRSVQSDTQNLERAAVADRLRKVTHDARFDPKLAWANRDGDAGIIRIFGEIGDYGDGIGAERFAQMLDDLGPVSRLEIWLNSGGGDAFAGLSILSMLRRQKTPVDVLVTGLAASAASIIMLGASPGRLSISENAEVMIHRASLQTVGDAAVHQKSVDILTRLDSTIAGSYAARTGRPADYWQKLMAVETWFNAKEAVAVGLCDRTY
jgi:ATP-dependent protease ClpP protease subunit